MTVSPPVAAPAATIGRRVGAFAIDVGIAWAIGALLVGIVAAIIFGVGPAWERDGLAAMILFSYIGIALALFAWWLIYSAMQGGRGSIGQRILKLRLHDATAGAPIGFWRAVWRNIVFGLAGSIIVGYFSPLFDQSGRRQGWHDMAARAVVVDARKTDAATPVPAEPEATVNPYLPPPTGAASLPPAPPLQPAAPVPAAGFMPTPGAAAAPISRPAAPASTGLIDGVPWVTGDPEHAPIVRESPPADPFPHATTPFPAATTTEPLQPGAATTTAASAPAAQPAAPLAGPGSAASVISSPPADDDVDSTRMAVPPPAQRAALYDGAPVIAVLTWDDGTRMAVYGRTLYGRNPANEDGAVAIAVRDETLSLSKTHFEIGGDTRAAWIVDRHSTNGTTLVRDGGRIPLTPGVRTTLRAGDGLEFGDRRVSVGAA
jgi:uncharacterized RDD family membrane protein YckC